MKTQYAIAILRQAYQPDLSGIETAKFVEDSHGDILYYDDIDEARAAVTELESEPYCTSNGESGAPEYLIVDDVATEYVASGRSGDGSNYDWDFECDSPDNKGNHCGECNACITGIIDEDQKYIRDNTID